MIERLLSSDKDHKPKQNKGLIIFDKYGNAIGIRSSNGQFDYGNPTEPPEIKLVIDPKKTDKDENKK